MPKLTLAHLVTRFRSDSLFRNSLFLMLSTAVQAGFGFLFWMLCARLFTPAEIGLGSTLIAGLTLIAYVSLLGFNDSLIKYLPRAKNANAQINSGLLLTALAATAAGIVYLLFTIPTSHEFAFFWEQSIFLIIFIILGVFSTANLLIYSVFIAYRQSQYNLIIYTAQSIVKLSLPIFFVGWGAFGISTAVGLAAAISFLLSLYFAAKKLHFQLQIQLDREVLKKSWRFTGATYIANLFNILPPSLLPLIIIQRLGAESAGYFYIVFMIANLLYAIGYAICNSLFAEGVHGEIALRALVSQAARLWTFLALPIILILSLLGPFLLELFGKSYGAEGQISLVMLLLMAPLVYAYNITSSILRIQEYIPPLLVTNIVYAVTICALAWFFSEYWGLTGIVIAWGAGHLISALFSGWKIYYKIQR